MSFAEWKNLALYNVLNFFCDNVLVPKWQNLGIVPALSVPDVLYNADQSSVPTMISQEGRSSSRSRGGCG
jgi:hypothetical protein